MKTLILALIGSVSADTKHYRISKDCLKEYRDNEAAMFAVAKKDKPDYTDSPTLVKE